MPNIKSIESRNQQRKRNYAKGRVHNRNSHKRWTDVEEHIVLAHAFSDRTTAELIGRSVQAIQGKRVRLKR